MKKIFCITLLLLLFLTACSSKPKYGKLLEITEDDFAAVDIITLYEYYSQGREYDCSECSDSSDSWKNTEYYKIEPFIYGLLDSKNSDSEKLKEYRIKDEDFFSIAEMFFVSDAFPGDLTPNTGYDRYLIPYDYMETLDEPSVTLVPLGKTYYENGDIVYSFERRYDTSVIGYVDYTLNEYTVQEVPVIISDLYEPEDTLYKIKSVKGTADRELEEKFIVEISTPQDLAKMSADYAVNGDKYKDYLFVLTNDIDMTGVDFLPIGRNCTEDSNRTYPTKRGFCSEFDGQGYTIKNLSFDSSFPADVYGSHFISLFDTIAYDGTVKNVNVENININISADCTGDYYCAGFAVRISGHVNNCHTQGTIYNPSGGGGGFVQGIEGYNGTLIENCSADVDITGCWCMGGFVVVSSQEKYQKEEFFKVYNCSSFGSITAGRYDGMLYYYDVGEFGGFADKTYGGTFEKCHVQTPVVINDPAKFTGGFIANTESDPLTKEPAKFIDCTYSPTTTQDMYLIGMINWKNTKGDYGDTQFSPLEK